MHKPNLARPLSRRTDGNFAAPYEQGEIGPELFEAACNQRAALGVSCFELGAKITILTSKALKSQCHTEKERAKRNGRRRA
jgi:hypothetical protein